jgi:hypothetical protein
MVQPRNQLKLYFLIGGVCAIALGIRLLRCCDLAMNGR